MCTQVFLRAHTNARRHMLYLFVDQQLRTIQSHRTRQCIVASHKPLRPNYRHKPPEGDTIIFHFVFTVPPSLGGAVLSSTSSHQLLDYGDCLPLDEMINRHCDMRLRDDKQALWYETGYWDPLRQLIIRWLPFVLCTKWWTPLVISLTSLPYPERLSLQ